MRLRNTINNLKKCIKNLDKKQVIATIAFMLFAGGAATLASTVPDNAAVSEVVTTSELRQFEQITQNPVNLPYKLAGWVASNTIESVRALRTLSFVVFMLSVYGVFVLLRRWHGTFVSATGAALFATNAYALAVGRFAGPEVLLFAWPVMLSSVLWYKHGNSKKIAPLMLMLIMVALIYLPGAPYFMIVLLALFYRELYSFAHNLSWRKAVPLTLFSTLVIAPMVIAFVNDTAVLKEWLLLPNTIEFSELATNALSLPLAIIYRMDAYPTFTLGTLPLLDIGASAFFVIGLYAYIRLRSLERAKLMLATGIFAAIIGALGQINQAIILSLPFVLATVAQGIDYMLTQWNAVFPKNPFARRFGVYTILIVIGFSSFYQLNRFLLAWNNAPETRAIYTQSRIVRE